MKALLLVRVSTKSQDFKAQQKELEDYAKRLGYNELKIVADKESAIKLSEEERHGLNEMKSYLESNPDCKNVFVWEISRLARTEKVLQSIKDWLVSRKINLHILSENITLLDSEGNETAAGGLLFSLFGHLASQEMKIKKDRLNRGKAEAAEKGKFIGGASVKFGYTVNSDNYIIVNPEEAAIVKLIFDLYASNQYSLTTLIEELKQRGYKFSWDRLRYILSDRAYIGGKSDRNKLIQTHPVIIDEEIFNKVQDIKKNNLSTKSKESVNKKLALKILKCWKCGGSYGFSNCQYECNHHKYYKRFKTDRCNSVGINSDIMDFVLISAAKKEYSKYLIDLNNTTIKEVKEKIEVLEKKIDVAKRNLETCKISKDRVDDLFIDGDISETKYKNKKEEIKGKEDEQKSNLKFYKKEIESLKSSLIDLDSEENWEKESRELFILIETDSLDDRKVNEIVRKYIKVAYINEINHNNRTLKVICVIGISGKLYTYLYDFNDRSGRCRVIGLTSSFKGYYRLGNTCEYLAGMNLEEIKDQVEKFQRVIQKK